MAVPGSGDQDNPGVPSMCALAELSCLPLPKVTKMAQCLRHHACPHAYGQGHKFISLKPCFVFCVVIFVERVGAED